MLIFKIKLKILINKIKLAICSKEVYNINVLVTTK